MSFQGGSEAKDSMDELLERIAKMIQPIEARLVRLESDSKERIDEDEKQFRSQNLKTLNFDEIPDRIDSFWKKSKLCAQHITIDLRWNIRLITDLFFIYLSTHAHAHAQVVDQASGWSLFSNREASVCSVKQWNQ